MGQVIPYWQLDGSSLYQGHALDVLAALFEAGIKVHMVATSPPYWGLRDYGLPPVEWPSVSYAPMAGMPEIEVPGCDPGCRHEWGEEQGKAGKVSHGQGGSTLTGGHESWGNREGATQGQYCHLCGGWRGCLGLEPTVEMFVGHIVLIWRALWRVLRDDGTCWLNFGDSYANSRGSPKCESPTSQRQGRTFTAVVPPKEPSGLKPKDLIGIPWRVAFALQADGWYLRSDIVWAKGISFCSTYSGSCMPESVRDRPTKGHEYVFLLSKSKRYYYDGDAVREQYHTGIDNPESYKQRIGSKPNRQNGLAGQDGRRTLNLTNAVFNPAGRNLRSVWAINPGSYAGAHFATFPPALVEPMIKAGTSERGCCPKCQAPWRRVTEKSGVVYDGNRSDDTVYTGQAYGDRAQSAVRGPARNLTGSDITTTGWRPTCTCDAGDPVPCVVLDPFGGSGTTADVARQLGRRWILIELSQDYCDDHIIPRLTEPLMEWAQEQEEQPEEPTQLEMF